MFSGVRGRDSEALTDVVRRRVWVRHYGAPSRSIDIDSSLPRPPGVVAPPIDREISISPITSPTTGVSLFKEALCASPVSEPPPPLAPLAVPPYLKCELSGHTLNDPVTTPTGHTYEVGMNR